MRAPVSRIGLNRIAREVTRAGERRENASRASQKARDAAGGGPSGLRALSGWREAEEAAWGGRDLLGYYASAYVREVGEEDPELRSAEVRGRLSGMLSNLIRQLKEGESPREYVDWAIGACLRPGKQWPKDGTVSVSVLVYNWILLKRWRAAARRPGGLKARGAEWEEGE